MGSHAQTGAATDHGPGICARYGYETWNNPVVEWKASGIENQFRFSTKQWDRTPTGPPDLGLIYFGARYLDPELGRWTQMDPAGILDGLNMYLFLRNQPPLAIDADGAGFGNLILTGKWSATEEEHDAAWNSLKQEVDDVFSFFDNHDWGWEAGFLIYSVGEVLVTCCDEHNCLHKATFRKDCWGFVTGVALSTHALANVAGENCPDAYDGVFWEYAVLGLSGEVGGDPGNAERVSGGGVSLGVGLAHCLKLVRCKYKLQSDAIVGTCGR